MLKVGIGRVRQRERERERDEGPGPDPGLSPGQAEQRRDKYLMHQKYQGRDKHP